MSLKLNSIILGSNHWQNDLAYERISADIQISHAGQFTVDVRRKSLQAVGFSGWLNGPQVANFQAVTWSLGHLFATCSIVWLSKSTIQHNSSQILFFAFLPTGHCCCCCFASYCTFKISFRLQSAIFPSSIRFCIQEIWRNECQVYYNGVHIINKTGFHCIIKS